MIQSNSFRSILSRNKVGISLKDKDLYFTELPATHLQCKCCLCAIRSVGGAAKRIRKPIGAKGDQ